MTAYLYSPGQPGLRGSGVAIYTWTAVRCGTAGDPLGFERFLFAWSSNSSNSAQPGSIGVATIYASRPGTLRNLIARILPTFGDLTLRVRVNGVDTALAVTFTSAGGTATDLVNDVAVNQGDAIMVVATYSSGVPANTTTSPIATVGLF